MNRFLLATSALALVAAAHLGHADAEKPPVHSLAYGSSINAEIEPCG